jgi:UDP-N-acetylmuramate dehydrogenase
MVRFQSNVLLAGRVAYKIGGRARYFFTAKNVADLAAALQRAHAEKLDVFVLGEGTNLLVHDRGFRGLVVRPHITGLKASGNRVYAGAGVPMRELVAFAARKGLSGLEWAGGLPGTVGGAVRGNAGAFGGEIKDSITKASSLNIRTLRTVERTRRACRFGYRSSIFKEKQGEEIVLGAVFQLKKGNPVAIRRATEEKITYRKSRHPLEHPNVGSIFKNIPFAQFRADAKVAITRVSADTIRVHRRGNPRMSALLLVKRDPVPVVLASRLISECGLKGARVGGAEVSTKHANFIVNKGGATAADVKKLIKRVKAAVKKKFGIVLEPEVQIL